jgi:hypothetical protein
VQRTNERDTLHGFQSSCFILDVNSSKTRRYQLRCRIDYRLLDTCIALWAGIVDKIIVQTAQKKLSDAFFQIHFFGESHKPPCIYHSLCVPHWPILPTPFNGHQASFLQCLAGITDLTCFKMSDTSQSSFLVVLLAAFDVVPTHAANTPSLDIVGEKVGFANAEFASTLEQKKSNGEL